MGNNRVIWFEVLTPKQAMLFLAIGERLQEYGFNCHYTTRKHDYILDIFQHNNVKPNSFGIFGGKTLEGKLVESSKRVVELAQHIIDLEVKPSLAISFSSPDASRVAFGLAIPLVLYNDTSHSVAVGKLTFSLAKYLITPNCINKSDFIKIGAREEIIHQYNGVDEIEYISGKNLELFKRKRASSDERYLVFRPEETFASYMKNNDSDPYLEIIDEIHDNYDGRILVFPRYPQQREIIEQQFGEKVEIQENGLYFLDLLSKAEVVITGGGTMGREAALLGIPSITYFWRHLEPQRFIEELGFPSYSTQTLEDTKKIIKKICSNPSKYEKDTTKLLDSLEKPSDKLIKVLKKDNHLANLFD